ncbi:RNA polymerase sigma-70 factor, ECF subfamily [Desulfofundulus australicus DSM 11792]|uniref:RNA polymerase sigma-70 factor, ECF subfamily n=1 Tax=Desulfofundulus australicus DSM 11792 TaxID=1121425 RepID=A0A1M5BBC4_9FIRM|nr:RNA polymerase sigma factor [Desulfofundulus australicus]SHF39686.1 RNA polymerase sigma-70 factor, ECF subfamily [Desulfofundulus australicus DSM 11792]
MEKETLLQKLKNKDPQALRFLYEMFYKPLFQAAFFIVNDVGLAEDVVHEVFLKLHHKIDQLQDPSKLGVWLRRMAVNTAWDMVRNRAKSTLIPETEIGYAGEQFISPELICLDKEERLLVQKALRGLQPDHRIVLYLKYYEDMSIDQISNFLNIPVNTVKSRLIRARMELKKLLYKERVESCHFKDELTDTKGVK